MINHQQQILIPNFVKVGSGALPYLGKLLYEHKLKTVVIFYGSGMQAILNTTIRHSLASFGIELLQDMELDDTNIETITSLAFSIPNEAQAVLGIGGGKAIDSAKYAAFLRRMPFICVPTSSSSDGFSSSSASLLVGGRRTSVPAKIAYGILVDIDVIKNAPEKFIYSGIGDLLSKITAVYDWVFEYDHGVGELNDFAMMIAKKAVNSFVRTPFNSIKDDVFLKELVDSLAMSGIANEMAGSSIPSSGSEHLISHALDKISPAPQLHGIQVGIATYLMSKVQDHRYKRIDQVFTDTGFWEYVKTLSIPSSLFAEAIDVAPSIKPYRHTYLHEEKYREEAKKILATDPRLTEVLA